MTYNYFNAGRLAFGKKIKAVFNSLGELLKGAEDHLSVTIQAMAYYNQFFGNNYQCPTPTRGNMPARSDEVFEVIPDATYFKDITCTSTDLTIKAVTYSRQFQRITEVSGTTKLRKGFAIAKQSIDLNDFSRELRFSETDDSTPSEIVLFQFECDGAQVYITNSNIYSDFNIGDVVPYSSLSITQIATGSYTSSRKAECVLVKMGVSSGTTEGELKLVLNGNTIFYINGTHHGRPHFILYLKNGDKLTGTGVGQIFRINYNTL